jgi:hypothetical protein
MVDLSDLKTRVTPAWPEIVDLHGLDPSAARPLAHVALESFQRFSVTLRGNLDTTVGKIPDPAVQSLPSGGGFDEKPETDALYTPSDQVPPRATHTANEPTDQAPSCGVVCDAFGTSVFNGSALIGATFCRCSI